MAAAGGVGRLPRRRPEPLAVPNEPIGAGLPEVTAGEAEPAVAAEAPEGSPDVAGSDMCVLFFLNAHPAPAQRRQSVAGQRGERMCFRRAYGAQELRLDAGVKVSKSSTCPPGATSNYGWERNLRAKAGLPAPGRLRSVGVHGQTRGNFPHAGRP